MPKATNCTGQSCLENGKSYRGIEFKDSIIPCPNDPWWRISVTYTWSLKVPRKMGTSTCFYRAMYHFLEYFGGSRYIHSPKEKQGYAGHRRGHVGPWRAAPSFGRPRCHKSRLVVGLRVLGIRSTSPLDLLHIGAREGCGAIGPPLTGQPLVERPRLRPLGDRSSAVQEGGRRGTCWFLHANDAFWRDPGVAHLRRCRLGWLPGGYTGGYTDTF